MMKIRHKKIVASGTAVALAGILGVGTLLQSSVSVQASPAMMPGIEQIVNDTTAEKPFKILEIVDRKDEAEIGYYVSGQEPYVKLYSYTYKYKENNEEKEETINFKTLEEGLKKLPTEELRKEFATNMKTAADGTLSGADTGIKNIQSSSYQAGNTTDSEENYPLSYSEYQEKYFLSDSDDTEKWQKINFQKIDGSGNSRTDTVKIKGNYRENTAGTGDYTKQEQQYYPIRQDDNDDKAKPEKYRENIRNFYYADNNTADAPYFLEFQEVDNNTVNQAFDANHNKINNNSILKEYDYSKGNYGYYENVYSDLTEEIVQNIQNGNYTFPGENPALPSDDEKLAVKIPDNTNTRAVNAKSFSDGNDEFSSINEADADNTVDANTQADTQPDVSSDGSQASQPADSSSADAFSTGDFSDGISDSADGDIEDGDNSQTHVADSASADTDFNSVTDTGTDFSADANAAAQADADSAQNTVSIDNDKITPIINYSQTVKKDANNNEMTDANGNKITEQDPAVGTSANPKVYYGVTIDQYPYYKYTLISDMKKIVACANANAGDVKDGTFTPVRATTSEKSEKNITFQDNQYWYWTVDENGNTVKNPISIVTQRQPVSYEDIREIPTTLLGYNYYCKVSQAYFCCKKSASSEDSSAGTGEQLPYRYFGWYVPSYPQNQDVYIPVIENDGKTATHYISDAEYKLTPGTGNYDFIPDDTAPEQTVEVDHMYYQGGYTNHDWFKQYVFHLEPGEEGSDERKQFDAFKIEVTTITADEFNKNTGSDHSSADTSVNSDDAQADNSQTDDIQSDDVQTDNTSDDQNTDTQNANEAHTEDQAAAQNEGDTSEVDPMVSEAGVELVSIEKEISDSSNSDVESESDNSVTADFQDGSDEEEFSDSSDTQAAFSAGDTNSADINNPLSEYDLIYVNGNINRTGFQKIYNSANISKSIPCIINAAKVNTGSEDNDLKQAVSEVIKDTDADGHYVNTCIYFFKNTFQQENISDLISKNFNTVFYSKDEGNTFSDSTEAGGFEEILDYVDSENRYRELESDNTGKKIDPLSTELSQARVIEYIINYQYRRQINEKSDISVLEIDPAKSDNSHLDESEVLSWIKSDTGVETKAIITGGSFCCEEIVKENTPFINAYDKNADTFWHSNWSGTKQTGSKLVENHPGTKHWFVVNFENQQTINKFKYTPRKYTGDGTQNGKFQKVKLTFYSSSYDSNNPDANKINTTPVEKEFSYSDVSADSAKTVPFGPFENVKAVKVEVEASVNTPNQYNASAAEISFSYAPDIPTVTVKRMTSSEYVGHIDDICSKYDLIYIGDKYDQGIANVNDTVGDNGSLYTHVGGLKGATDKTYKLMGLYPQDFTGEDMNINSATNSFRGSGNDITLQQYNDLMNFVKSGYPVVLGDNLISGGSVNTTKVDNSSYMYKFLSEAISYNNVMSVSQLKKDQNKISFYTTLAKPEIQFTAGGKPPEAPRDGHATGEEIKDKSGTAISSYNYLNGELVCQFSIKNDSAVLPASTRYDCKLYFDLNFDGNLSKTEEQGKYIEIRDSSQNVMKQSENKCYELKAGEVYTLTRKIPSDYYKIITWKLEIINNSNSNVKTSVTGYSKQKNNTNNTGQKVDINILQIVPEKTCADSDNNNKRYTSGTWDLKQELENQEGIYNYVKDLEDFNISKDTVTRLTVSQFTNDQNKTPAEILEDKQMLIIGFDDVYENIPENGAKAIDEFIKAGKSVIFSHDTTSLYNYNYNKDHNTVKGNVLLYDSWLISHSNGKEIITNGQNWGVSMNKIRETVGMDRYGITNTTKLTDGTTVSELLKRGNDLTDNSGVSFTELQKSAGDIAYQFGRSCAQSYKQTQGYTNGQIDDEIDAGSGGSLVTEATKVNDGAITQYPYIIKDSMRIAKTHMQYYQLALEQDKDNDGENDIVVWYCLGSRKAQNETQKVDYYANSYNDVRNNYYFYSKGNVIYTGAGHSWVHDSDEMKLFVNAMVAAANVAAVKPEVDFVKSLNENAQKETVRYYMTDQTSWNTETAADGNVLEKNMELYFRVKDYNMVSADLTVSAPAQMTVNLYIDDEQKGTCLSGADVPEELKNKKVSPLTEPLTPCGKGKAKIEAKQGTFHLEENNTYGFTVPAIEQYLKKTDSSGEYKSNCKVYVKVTSTIKLYGKDVTSTSWAPINLKQRQLFDLD
jgi:hypothetical protein